MKAKLLKTIFFILVSVASFASGHNLDKDSAIVKTDTLHILISKENFIYYYDNTLMPDASNFKVTNWRGLRNIIYMFTDESKQKGHELIILLKIQKQSALNEGSRKAIDEVKHKNYKQVDLLPMEEEIIGVTEKYWKESKREIDDFPNEKSIRALYKPNI